MTLFKLSGRISYIQCYHIFDFTTFIIIYIQYIFQYIFSIYLFLFLFLIEQIRIVIWTKLFYSQIKLY